MKLQLKHTYQLAGVVLLLLGTLTMGAAVMSSRSGALAEEAAARRYLSYQLADELRQSSDDLTRLARTYVATGDPKWESQYLEVVDIRAGKRPRPAQYDRIYWDFRAANAQPEAEAAGQAVPLLELMKQAGFTEAELGKLAEAQANSDDLIHTEARAMRMVKEAVAASQSGTQWLDTPEHSQALALMHDLTYHQQKAKIMKPVNEFLALLDERTSAEMAAASVARHRWSQMAMAFVATLIVLMGGGLFYLRHRTSAVLDDVSRVATGIAQGRLDHAIPTALSGQEGGVMRALERMQRQLARVVGSIRQSADSVVTASTQIALGNQDLSARTEQQASALEQTAATMEELGTTVRHNADSASQANELAQNASAVAVQGGQVVDQVVSTMQNISDSSRRIGDIIGVIDGIAFQTNILALNAAVEAARAGEQGRGFAVVAGEVRSLAHRSAEAAKEIKTLIGRSVEQVEQGTELVNQAGRTMGDIVGSIQRVSDIVAEITAASTEQSNGVQQVGDAVGQLDHATQQNAALVEQSAAAAESLKAQASELVQAAAVFQLQNPAQAVV